MDLVQESHLTNSVINNNNKYQLHKNLRLGESDLKGRHIM